MLGVNCQQSMWRGMADGFDGRTCRYLHIDHDALTRVVSDGASDEQVLAWCFDNGRTLSEEDI
jgi:hypothetical protein